MKKVIEVQTLHMSVGRIPVGVSGTSAVYLVKLRAEPVPHCASPAAARTQLPNFLEWNLHLWHPRALRTI